MITKTRVDELAIFGAPPAFAEKLHVGRPNVGDRGRLLARVSDILDRRWFTNNGFYVQEFERNLAAIVGVKHCIAMCNATVALEIAIRALGLQGEVIVPSFTFIATAHALQWQNLTPVFCDVDFQTHNLDPSRIEELITPRTTGIVGVHLWGRPCNVEALTEIAARRNLKLLFDAAHALGSSARGQMVGGFGQAEVFSFHATKFCNSFEGGAVTTNNDDLAARLRLLKNFGFVGYDQVDAVGTNGKMSEISAAMGLTSLESRDDFIAVNRLHHRQYEAALRHVPGITLLSYDQSERNNYQYIVIELDESVTQISRDQLVELLWAENVIARRYFYPGCHRMEPYRSIYPQAGQMLPVTERLVKRVMQLPTGTSVDSEQIAAICQLVQLAVSQGEAISGRLARKNNN
ncbi:MAG: DegT/DnrJ/EryC1/StrS family aminotransferase [Acidobacteriota bacterium]|nr:DegT/DnrJ/EryC1/StrS family aminotransferase [Acidobacteriota bacterium]